MYKNFQNSPGVLKKQIMDVDIESIKFLSVIPPFTTPSTVAIPLLAKSNDKFFCLSGDEIIFAAISKKQKTIQCIVEDHGNGSMLELSFRKVIFRMVPEGGRCSYGEKVRAIKCLEMFIKNFSEDIIINGHGGDRRSGEYNSGNSTLADIIGEKLQIDRNTVNSYLNHARYLNEEALKFFAEEKIKKSFFEKAQIIKRQLLIALQARSTSTEEITRQVSTKMQQWHHTFAETGRITETEETVLQDESIVSPANEATTIINKNEAEDGDVNDTRKIIPVETQYPELTIVPSNPIISTNPKAKIKEFLQSQIAESIHTLSKALDESADISTIYQIIATAANDLHKILPAEKEVVNG